VLVKKSIRACVQHNTPRLVIAGGVSANDRLRDLVNRCAEKQGISVFMPHPKHCTDNAAMIAYAAFERNRADLSCPCDWDVLPRWVLSA